MKSLTWLSVIPMCSSLALTQACSGAKPEGDVLEVTTAALAADAGESELPVKDIEDVIGAKGEVSNGVLDIELERSDIGDVSGPREVTFTSSFEINGDLHFQSLPEGRALLNGDLPVLQKETNAFIAALLEHHLVFQAFHQHLPMDPQVWFIHFRGEGEPLELARNIRAAIALTATPLPQPASDDKSTPLDTDRLSKILHGSASVGEDGVVTVTVPRSDRIRLGHVGVQPEAGVSTTIAFKPSSGDNAAVVPDFALTGAEVDPVLRQMLLEHDWYQGCLYNQETQEHPQLYFDHMLKQGDPYDLAQEIRQGLDLTAAE